MQIYQAQTNRIVMANILNSRRGFTLLELMIVLGITAALVALALPRIGSQNNQMRKAVRQISAISRELHTNAKLQGAIFRLVIDLGSDAKDKKVKQFYWVEKSTSKTILKPDEMTYVPSPETPNSQEDSPPSAFALDTKITKEKRELPGELRFEDIEMKRSEAPFVNGIVYIHFFPQGLAEEAVIHIKGSERMKWTLAIHPLTGKTDIATEYISLKEFKE